MCNVPKRSRRNKKQSYRGGTKNFFENKKPILGICRGCQLINVALGGSLYQYIINSNEHSSFGKEDLIHKLKVPKGNFLFELYGADFYVNSAHHQAVKDIGEGLEIIATTDDGATVEVIKHKELPIYGVQWHPERMCFSKKREATVDGAEILNFFVDLCKKH